MLGGFEEKAVREDEEENTRRRLFASGNNATTPEHPKEAAHSRQVGGKKPEGG